MHLLIAAVVAAGAAAPPARPIDPAALAAAKTLVAQLGVREQILRGLNQNIAAMKSGAAMRAMLAGQPGFIPAYQANRARFDAALQKAGGIQAGVAQKAVTANIDAVTAEAARAYARNYSLAEIQALSNFYRSPLGQAFARKQPQVSAEIGVATGRIIGARIDAGMQAAAPQLQAALAPLNSAPPAKK